MTIISSAARGGRIAGLVLLLGALHGHAEAALLQNSLSHNALTNNALTNNALGSTGARQDAATPGVGALEELNGVAVEGVVLPRGAQR